MTYIEFYDKNAVENVCACLANLPEVLVLVGLDESELDRNIAIYEKMFKKRKQTINFSKEILTSWEPPKVIDLLDKLVNKYEDCVFGITGGEESIIYALGVIKERYSKEKNIQVHSISVQDNVVYDCDMDGETIEFHTPTLSVKENIQIYGGKIMYGNVYEDKTYPWNMNFDFEKDIEKMWEICRMYLKPWNKQIGAFKSICENGTMSEDGLTVTAECVENRAYYINPEVRKALREAGLAWIKVSADKSVMLTFKNRQVKRCLTQEGLALEMKIFKMSRELVDDENRPIYNDVVNGVLIDWDGKNVDAEKEYCNTKNEIDVLVMHNMIPVFISCKNRFFVEVEELYKLNTVAERFGGKYAKKVLVIRTFDSDKVKETILQRASDMGIPVIYGDDVNDDEKLKIQLANMWKEHKAN